MHKDKLFFLIKDTVYINVWVGRLNIFYLLSTTN